MRPVQHPTNPPQALQRAVSHGASNWDQFKEKEAVADVLLPLQQYLCAYCQIRLDSGIGHHIEHIWPKHAHVAMTFQWTNLVLSCTHSNIIGATRRDGGVSCGHSSGKRFWPAHDPRFISPTTPDCERFFEYLASNGEIKPANDLDQADRVRATYTIDLLNLNCPRLKRLRKDMLETGYKIIRELMDEPEALAHFLDAEFAAINHKLGEFFTARQQHFQPFVQYSASR